MPSYSTNEILTNEIISHVRCTILDQMSGMPDMDPWNEQEGGAAWLDNELGFATDFLVQVKPVQRIDWGIYHSVNEVKRKLISLQTDELRFIKYVAVTLGGTQHDYLFQLRDQPARVQRSYFNNAQF